MVLFESAIAPPVEVAVSGRPAVDAAGWPALPLDYPGAASGRTHARRRSGLTLVDVSAVEMVGPALQCLADLALVAVQVVGGLDAALDVSERGLCDLVAHAEPRRGRCARCGADRAG